MLVEETTASPDVILFIAELHNLIGQGTAMGAAMDAANMLKPSLVRGDFRVIGATTDEEYERWVGGDPALERRFQKVTVRELGVRETVDIILARKERLERHHNVVITDEAIEAAVALTDQYVTDRRRPDKAIDALDEACAHTQALCKYPPRAETLIRERVRLLREVGARRGARERSATAPSPDDAEWQQMARDGMTALERFGAELEKMFAAPVVAGPAATPPPRPEPVAPEPPPPTLGELETELSRVLAEEGIVVRGHDVARVVGLMSGKPIAWDR